jgi:hypothetical protein
MMKKCTQFLMLVLCIFVCWHSQAENGPSNGGPAPLLLKGAGLTTAPTDDLATAFAPPTNNECTGATLLTPGSTCTTTAGTTVEATQSIAPITCNGFTSSSALDVWYKFVATATTHAVTVVGGSSFDAIIDVRSGACNGTNIGCADATTSGGTETTTVGGLTVGTTYFVRVYSWAGGTGTFTICVTGGPVAPANDDCANATLLTSGTTCTSTAGTNVNATQSLASITCASFTSSTALDVWYKFTAVATTHTVTVTGGTGFDAIIDVRSGSCNGTNIGCADATTSGGVETTTVSGLTVGNTYLVRVYGWAGGTGTFTICVTHTTPAPANNDCANATTLTPGSTCTPTSGTTVNATQSIAAITCATFTGTADDDVWYKFTATAANHNVTVVGGAGFDAVVDVRSGGCNGTNIGCADATTGGGTEAVNLSGLTVGSTYLVRVYSFGSLASNQGTFSICVTTPVIGSAPACASAPTAPTNGGSACPGSVTLSWPAVADATSYDVYFGTAAVPPFVSNVAVTTFNAGTLAAGTYFWQIRPRNAIGVASGCTIWSFTVGDATAPSITCPASVMAGSPANACAAVVSYGSITATDNCTAPSITLASGQASNTSFPVGVNTVIYRATDAAGNSSTCSFTVTVKDVTAPSITCPASVTASAPSNACSAVVSYGSISATDNCTAPSITLIGGLPGSSSFPVGVTTVTYRATDPSNNSNTCSFTVTVNDVTLPTITCPANVTVNNSPATACSAPATYGSITATDNCTAPTITLTSGQASGSTFPLGTTTNVYRATDGSGNTRTCSFTVTVRDVTPPMAKCKNAAVNLAANGTATLLPSTVNNLSTDNCSLTLSVTPSALSCSNVGTNVVTLKATDGSGNTATCTAIVTVKDVTPPSAVCSAVTVFLDATGHASITPGQVGSTSTDACGISTLTLNNSQFNCSHINGSPVTVVMTVRDVNNNQSTCYGQVYVKDNIAPTPNCIDRSIVLSASGTATVQTAPLASGSADNCSVTSYSPVAKQYNTSNIGVNNLTITVRDFSNNSATCVSQITVLPYGSTVLVSDQDNDGAISFDAAENYTLDVPFELSLFPNPTSGSSTLQFRLPEEQSYHLRLLDVNGRLLIDSDFDGYAGENSVQLEMGSLHPGIYLVEVESAGLWGRKKVVVQE